VSEHPAEFVAVFVTTAVRTSAGPGPGVRHIPAAEAAQLIARRHAVTGERPPKGYEDGGADPRAIAAAGRTKPPS
jgi:hypothetical protein